MASNAGISIVNASRKQDRDVLARLVEYLRDKQDDMAALANEMKIDPLEFWHIIDYTLTQKRLEDDRNTSRGETQDDRYRY